ncbi:MAG: archaeal proteasome endopeptidase complex subunit beta [Candidatus Bathyarchaeota archaeon]|nr:archaeal proteasome endopeptidase complex subunit beta [Candidatus Bathyarchaeota archaeon]
MSDQAQGRFSMPGATTIGLVFDNGVILASEKRATWGSMIMSKTVKKVFTISEQVGVACAGLISDMQVLSREVEAQAKLFTLNAKRPMSVKAASKVMSNVLFNRRMIPLITQTIVGGMTGDKPEIYVLDLLGSLLPDEYAAVGSGAQMATGVLEQGYKDNMTQEDAKALVLKAIRSAVRRDTMSGDGVDILIVTKDGIVEESANF